MFIEGLPVMLQIALFLLTCGLSRYMWSVNTSVARVVISITVLDFLFCIGIVAAGMSSYECPFQTPVLIALRHLRDSETARKLLSSLPLANIISLFYTALRNTPRLLASLSLPNTASLIYATWMPSKDLSPHPVVLTTSRDSHYPGGSQYPTSCLVFVVQLGRSGTESSFYFSRWIERSGTQSRDWPKKSECSGVRGFSQLPPGMRTTYLIIFQGYDCAYGTWKAFEDRTRTVQVASAGSSEISLTPKPSTLPYALRGPFDGLTAIPTTTHRST